MTKSTNSPVTIETISLMKGSRGVVIDARNVNLVLVLSCVRFGMSIRFGW